MSPAEVLHLRVVKFGGDTRGRGHGGTLGYQIDGVGGVRVLLRSVREGLHHGLRWNRGRVDIGRVRCGRVSRRFSEDGGGGRRRVVCRGRRRVRYDGGGPGDFRMLFVCRRMWVVVVHDMFVVYAVVVGVRSCGPWLELGEEVKYAGSPISTLTSNDAVASIFVGVCRSLPNRAIILIQVTLRPPPSSSLPQLGAETGRLSLLQRILLRAVLLDLYNAEQGKRV